MCARYVTRTMGLAVSKLYITKYFDKDARKEVTENKILANYSLLLLLWNSRLI